MIRKRVKGENRTDDEIREHYEIEKDLAYKLKKSTKHERKSQNLYTAVYDELFRRVPHHQQLTKKKSQADTARAISWQLGLLRRFINKDTTVLEVGPGDCSLSFKLSEMVGKVFAVDVSNIITNNLSVPSKFELIISDGSSISLPDESIDMAYSNQLMEHIHPDDAKEQLQDIFRVLKPSGCYVCITPNKVNGPWDISYYYDEVAKGFHLKEYTMSELISLFEAVGFRKYKAYVGARGKYIRFPNYPIVWLEKFLSHLPAGVKIMIGRSIIFRIVLGIKLVGIK